MIFHHFAVLWSLIIWKKQNEKSFGDWFMDNQMGIAFCMGAALSYEINLQENGGRNTYRDGGLFDRCSTFLFQLIDHLHKLTLKTISSDEEENMLNMLVHEYMKEEVSGIDELKSVLARTVEKLPFCFE